MTIRLALSRSQVTQLEPCMACDVTLGNHRNFDERNNKLTKKRFKKRWKRNFFEYLCTNLIAALASLKMNNFTHVCLV